MTLLRDSPAQAFTVEQPVPVEPNGAGQKLIIENESVELTFISVSAGFNNEFGRWEPLPTQSYFLCHDVEVGYTVAGGRYTGPQEIIFYLTTPEDNTWKSGPGSRNTDGFPHARMTQIGTDTVHLEWEDLAGGGDEDYDDCVVDIVITKLASLTIEKDVVPDDLSLSLWDFTIDGPDAESDRTIDDLPDGGSQTETLLSPGSYTVTETTTQGEYSTSVDCGTKGSASDNNHV
ncbi:unnamed protein product, partial [marine sediment metagenome]